MLPEQLPFASRGVERWRQQKRLALHFLGRRLRCGDDILEVWRTSLERNFNLPSQLENFPVNLGIHIRFAWPVVNKESRMRASPFYSTDECGQVEANDL